MRKVALLTVMILIWGGGFMWGGVYERGMEYLLEQLSGTGGELRKAEEGILLRSLHLQLGAEIWDWSELGNREDEAGEVKDLGVFMRRLWQFPLWQSGMEDYVNDDGGWPAESGGASECGATMLGLSHLLDACSFCHQKTIRQGMDFLLRTCCANGSLGSFQVPDGCGDGGLGGRLEFLVLVGQLFREGCLKEKAQEEEAKSLADQLGKELGTLSEGSSCYEAGLYLRGISLLGIEGRRAELTEWLAGRQGEDGSWTDRRYGRDLAVTCVVIDGLSGAMAVREAAESGANGNQVSVSVGVEEFERDVLHVKLVRPEHQAASVTVYDSSGKVVKSFGTDVTEGPFSFWFGNFCPGVHEVMVRRWHRPGLGQCGESRFEFTVPQWSRLESVSIRRHGVPRRVDAGEEVVFTPLVCLTGSSNGSSDGVGSCRLESKDGTVLCDFGSLQFVCNDLTWEGDLAFDSRNVKIPSVGYYVLKVEVLLGEAMCREQVLIISEESCPLDLENYLVPDTLETGRQVCGVRLRLKSGKGIESGMATSIGNCQPAELQIGMENDCHELTLMDVRDSRGRPLRDGMLVVRTDTGMLEGGLQLPDERQDCRTRAYRVRNGACVFRFWPGELWRNSCMSFRVYGCLQTEGVLERLGLIGAVEVRLSGTPEMLEARKSFWGL